MLKSSILTILRTFTSKKIYTKQQCSKIITQTSTTIQKVAQITLGPYGRNIMIQNQMQSPRITKDGITVVKNIQFQNRLQDAISNLIKKSVDGTNKFAGDGTTTSTILIGQILKRSYKKISIGYNTKQIRKGFQIGRQICLEFLDSCARKITNKQQLMNVAMISTNGKQHIAKIVVQALLNSSKVRIQKSNKMQNTIQYHKGLTIPHGLSSQQFYNTNQNMCRYNYPLVVTSLQPINKIKDIIKCLQLIKKSRKQLIIFAPDFSQAVKSTIIYNNSKKIIQCSYILIPQLGDKTKMKQYIQQISKFTQSYIFQQYSNNKIQNIQYNQFGKAIKIQSNLYETKIQTIQKQNNKNIQGIILVGGKNQIQLLQNYDHMIDALNSTKSAMKDGIIAGGGITFWRLGELLQKYNGQGQQGVKILAQVLKQPRKKLMKYIPIQKNPLGGQNWQGYDLKKQKIIDMFQAGIVDSVNVAKSIIIDSLSLCTVLVEVEIALARQDKNLSYVSLKQLSSKFKL